jgi:hypothetical protein
MHDAAISAGYPEDAVMLWLEEMQRISMDARFTLAWPPSAQKRVSMLLNELDNFLQQPHRNRSRKSPIS